MSALCRRLGSWLASSAHSLSPRMRPTRPPIHLGSGEPVLLLHPFLMSQTVWEDVAQQLADTGRYEVFAPTMAGHNGGPSAGTWFLSLSGAGRPRRAPDGRTGLEHRPHRRQLAGRLGRLRTGAARAGAQRHRHRAGGRLDALEPGQIRGDRQVHLGVCRCWCWPACSARGYCACRSAASWAPYASAHRPTGSASAELSAIVDDVTHCPAYFQLLVKALLLHGLRELAHTAVPAHLVLCGKDRVVPHHRFSRHFTESPAGRTTRSPVLDGVGHVPMFEAPDRITEVITGFIDECSPSPRAGQQPAG